MPRYFERNNTINLYTEFRNESNNLFDPLDLDIVKIYDPIGNLIADNLVPIKQEVGIYYVTVPITFAWEPGVYRDTWFNVNISGVGYQNINLSFLVFPEYDTEVAKWTYGPNSNRVANEISYGYNP